MHNETWKSAGKKNEYQWLPPGKGVDWTEGPLVGRPWCLDLYLIYTNISYSKYSIMLAHTHTQSDIRTPRQDDPMIQLF